MKKLIRLFSLALASLFTLDAGAQTFTDLHDFSAGTGSFGSGSTVSNSDGARPLGGLVIAGGALYGTCAYGGSTGVGVVFKLDFNGGNFTTIHAFDANSYVDGSYPNVGLIFANSLLYGTTFESGGNVGLVFSVIPNGSTQTPTFNVPHGYGGAAGLTASAGNLYGMTTYSGGGGGYSGTIFKIKTDLTGITNIYNFTDTTGVNSVNTDGAHPRGTMVLVGDTLYGTAELGGAKGLGTVFSIKTNGTAFKVLHTFLGGTTDGSLPTVNLAVSGNTLYGTTQTGGTGGTVFKINTDGLGYKVIYFLKGKISTSGGGSYAGVIVSGNTLYGMAESGGTSVSNSGALFSLNLDGTGYRVVSYVPSNLNGGFYNGLIQSGNTLYGTSRLGGVGSIAGSDQTNNGFVFSITLPAETTPPTLSITNVPVAGLYVSNSVFTVIGKAADNVAVSNVWVAVNGSAWSLANPGNNFANWSASVSLTPGLNVISAYAVDSSGNVSITNKVNVTYIVSGSLTVNINGRGTITPNYTNATLQISNRYTITASPAIGFAFTNWTDGSTTITNKPALTFQMASNLSFTANFIDIAKPVLSITNIPSNGNWSNSQFTVRGKAGDNVGVANVFYNLNSGGWITSGVNRGNNFTNWNVDLTLVPGVNMIAAYAQDAAGNVSPTNTVRLTYILSAPLTVNTNGHGTIAPNYNRESLQISNRYTMTATPGVGFVFTNWTDGHGNLVTNKPALSFFMASNLVFTANFVDVQKPVLTVTTPTATTIVTNAMLVARGTASNNDGPPTVSFNLNHTDWFAIGSTNNWQQLLELTPGTNYFAVYATDAAGNFSATNTVKFIYLTAPTTLNGLIGEVTPDGGTTFNIAFGLTTFSQLSSDPSNLSGNIANAVGSYTYVQQTPASGVLKLIYTAPPLAVGGGWQTNHLTVSAPGIARFTNEFVAGGIVFTSTPTVVLASLLNRSVVHVDTAGLGRSTLFLAGKYVSTNLFTGATNSGTVYTYTAYSPVGSLLKVVGAGGTNYFVSTFTGTNYGTFFEESYTAAGTYAGADKGVFGVASQRVGGNAPTNVVNRSALVTADTGSFKLSFLDTNNFVQLSATDDTVTNGLGLYEYARLAANSGNLNLIYTDILPWQTNTALLHLVAPNFAVFTNTDNTIGTAVLK